MDTSGHLNKERGEGKGKGKYTHYWLIRIHRVSLSQLVLKFDEHDKKTEVLSAIDGIKYPGGGTKTGAALNKAKSELFEKSARAGVPNIAIVITDGKSKDSIGAPAQQLRDSGCTVFSVGIGKNYNEEQLREMATDPDSQHVMKADFDALDAIIETIVGNACKGRCSQS